MGSIIGPGIIGPLVTNLLNEFHPFRWLTTKQEEGVSSEAARKAQVNLEAYRELCKRQLERFSAEMGQIDEKMDRLKARLQDPAFAVFLGETAYEAVQTDNTAKHAILSRLVIERLSLDTEDFAALILPDACKTIRSLTGDQLRFLAIITWVWSGRDSGMGASFNGLFRNSLPLVLSGLADIMPKNELRGADISHLAATSCVTVQGYSHPVADCVNQLRISMAHAGYGDEAVPESQAQSIRAVATELRRVLGGYDAQSRAAASLAPTTKGIVLGVCTFDELVGGKTELSRILEVA